MTDDDARKLATRIIDTWPASAKHYIWQSLLLDLRDERCAWNAYETLKKNSRQIPTTGTFRAEYESIRRRRAMEQQPAPTLPLDSETTIDRNEYLSRLRARAVTDSEAARELARWEHRPYVEPEPEPEVAW